MRMCSPNWSSMPFRLPLRHWRSWCWSPTPRTIRTVISPSPTAASSSRASHAGPTRASGCTGRNCSMAAAPADFRCCRCCGARVRRSGCMGSCSKAPGTTSAASSGSQPYNEGVRHPVMSTLKQIPVVIEAAAGSGGGVRSGQKYLTAQGFTAIKDGMKAHGESDRSALGGKPGWLRARMASGDGYDFVRRTVREHRLATVCEEAKCPNIGECWNAGTATIMLMGAVCTRACRFCAVDTGNPRGWLDTEEPRHVAAGVALMRLKYVVLTSVNRDDLADGGAAHYAACIRAIKQHNPETAVEALTPDFQGVLRDVATVLDAGPEVYAQNLETVRRLTHPVRDPRAGYQQTLAVLEHAKRHRPGVITKSSLMLGIGETEQELGECMDDLRRAGGDILTLGQYLRPTVNHLSVQRYVTPEQFEQYRAWGLARGFRECVSGPLVRSSYRAEQALAGNNVGLKGAAAAGVGMAAGLEEGV